MFDCGIVVHQQSAKIPREFLSSNNIIVNGWGGFMFRRVCDGFSRLYERFRITRQYTRLLCDTSVYKELPRNVEIVQRSWLQKHITNDNASQIPHYRTSKVVGNVHVAGILGESSTPCSLEPIAKASSRGASKYAVNNRFIRYKQYTYPIFHYDISRVRIPSSIPAIGYNR